MAVTGSVSNSSQWTAEDELRQLRNDAGKKKKKVSFLLLSSFVQRCWQNWQKLKVYCWSLMFVILDFQIVKRKVSLRVLIDTECRWYYSNIKKHFTNWRKLDRPAVASLWLLIYDWTINRVIQPFSGESEFLYSQEKRTVVCVTLWVTITRKKQRHKQFWSNSLFGGQLFLMDFKWNSIWARVHRPSSIGHFFKQLSTTCSPFLQPLIYIGLPVIAYCHSSLLQQQQSGANKPLTAGFLYPATDMVQATSALQTPQR